MKREDPLLILESMKIEIYIASNYRGSIAKILLQEWDIVTQGAPLVEIIQE